MEWLKVTIFTSSMGIEPVCGRLLNLGVTGTEIEDFDDFTGFLENNKQYWDYVDDELVESKKGETKVIIYIENTADGMETFLSVKNSMDELKGFDTDGVFGRLEVTTDELREEDWANNWKKYFHPIKIGNKLLVCPEWENCDDADGRVVFKINPGMTFGTGSHYTTKLCLEEIEKRVLNGDEVCDLGCGSGILSVVSLMLGASAATAVDIDENAVPVAYENAERNAVPKEKYRVLSGNIISDDNTKNIVGDRQYDVVLANIVADVIIAMAPFAYEITKNGGTFITSGIIEDRGEEVKTAIQNVGFTILEEKQDKDWLCFVCKKESLI